MRLIEIKLQILMDFKRISSRFFQLGGFRLLKEYARMGVLSSLGIGFFHILLSGKPPKQINSEIGEKIIPFLQDKYACILLERKAFYQEQSLNHQRSNVVWFCWLQGIEQAPPIVKACLASLKLHLTDREIKIITKKNWREYIDLPEHIIRRWDNKQIPPALFTDLLRLQLLIRHGGTWIDSTVLCTGTTHTKEFLDSDLFLFQYRTPETSSASFKGISNWFITSCTNNEVLLVLRDMLFAYWKDYDYTLYYFIFHVFFSMIAKEYPDIIANMPYGYSVWSLTLENHWDESFNQKKWDKLTSLVCFHKLYYRVDDKLNNDKGNYYNWILEKYR